MTDNYNYNWNDEYKSRGIPSSVRTSPSQSVQWFVNNWRYFSDKQPENCTVLDVGCGAGRNTHFLSNIVRKCDAFDASEIAIEKARKSAAENASFFMHQIGNAIPKENGSYDAVIDIFVYKHQIDPDVRRFQRQEIARLLKDDGIFLLSLAHEQDGYYSQCPPVIASKNSYDLTVVKDPVVDIDSVLYDYKKLNEELADTFHCIAMWEKDSQSDMHGKIYERKILTTVWKKK